MFAASGLNKGCPNTPQARQTRSYRGLHRIEGGIRGIGCGAFRVVDPLPQTNTEIPINPLMISLCILVS